jgi:hypothetical protein
MSIKYSMFSNGTVVAREDGNVRKATKEERTQYLSSLLPKSHKGESISAVAFNAENGNVYGKYGSITLKKTVAQQSTHKSEPVDGTQKVKETKVPSDKSKAKPETEKIVKDRPDVGKPKEVRTKEYQRGKGGENLHSDVVPRSESDGGLKGGKVADTAEETANKAKSGNPDTYVQELVENKKPTPAGNECNHAAGTEIKWENDQTIYNNLKLSAKDKDEKLPPWLKKEKDENNFNQDKDKEKDKDDKEDKDDKKDKYDKEDKEEKREKKESAEINSLQKKLSTKEIEIAKYEMKMGRMKSACKYALALSKLNPIKYANAEDFVNLIDETTEKMDSHAIEIALNELGRISDEQESRMETIQASASTPLEGIFAKGNDGNLSTAIMVTREDRFQKTASTDDLKKILMASTKLGQAVADWDENYTPSQPK